MEETGTHCDVPYCSHGGLHGEVLSGFDIVITCHIASDAKEIWFEQLEHLDWDASIEIPFESHFKQPPNVVWIQFAKIVFHVLVVQSL